MMAVVPKAACHLRQSTMAGMKLSLWSRSVPEMSLAPAFREEAPQAHCTSNVGTEASLPRFDRKG